MRYILQGLCLGTFYSFTLFSSSLLLAVQIALLCAVLLSSGGLCNTAICIKLAIAWNFLPQLLPVLHPLSSQDRSSGHGKSQLL